MNVLTRLVAFVLAWFPIGFPATAAWAADSMRIGVLPVVDTLPLWVAKERGYFTESGIDAELLSFDSALERDAALQAGKLEGYFGDLLNTVLLIRSGHPIRVATVAYHTDVRQRMFGVALQPGSKIERSDQLADQTIGISRSTVIEFLLDRMLIGSGVSASAVQRQDVKKIPIRMQLLLSGQMPAALLPEPLLSLAELKGAQVILDDRRLDMTETVIALKHPWVDAGIELLKRFLSAYGKAVETIRREPETTTDILVRHCRLPNELAPSYRPPAFPPVGLPSSRDIELVQQWLIEHRMILKPMDERDIVFSP